MEFGRRAGFRDQYPSGCAGSNPASGTLTSSKQEWTGVNKGEQTLTLVHSWPPLPTIAHPCLLFITDLNIRNPTNGDHQWLIEFFTKYWGAPINVTRRRVHQSDDFQGYNCRRMMRRSVPSPIGLKATSEDRSPSTALGWTWRRNYVGGSCAGGGKESGQPTATVDHDERQHPPPVFFSEPGIPAGSFASRAG